MSYVRFSEADVYVFLSTSGYLECCGCWLNAFRSEELSTTNAMITHLRVHQAAGHTVPERVFDALASDRDENDAWIQSKAVLR